MLVKFKSFVDSKSARWYVHTKMLRLVSESNESDLSKYVINAV